MKGIYKHLAIYLGASIVISLLFVIEAFSERGHGYQMIDLQCWFVLTILTIGFPFYAYSKIDKGYRTEFFALYILTVVVSYIICTRMIWAAS